MKKFFSLAAILLVLALAVASCGGGSDSTGSDGATSGGDSTSSDTGGGNAETGGAGLPTKAIAKTTPRTIGYISTLLSSPAEERLASATETAGKALGWDVKVRDGGGDPTKINAAIQAFASEKVDALLISSSGVEGNKRAADQLRKAGAPIIQVGGAIPPSDEYTAQYGEDEAQLAKILTERIIEDNPDGAKVGELTLSVAYATKVRNDTLKQIIGEDEGSEISASAAFDLTNAVSSTQEETTNMLLAHPDINAIWGTSDINILPAAKAIEIKRSDALVYSFFSAPTTLQAMYEGKPVGAVADCNLNVTGLVAIDQLLNHFETGDPVDKGALKPGLLEYAIVDPENAPPEGEVVYPLETTIAPYVEKWEEEYPLG